MKKSQNLIAMLSHLIIALFVWSGNLRVTSCMPLIQIRIPSMPLPFTYPSDMTVQQVHVAERFLTNLAQYDTDPMIPSADLLSSMKSDFLDHRFDLMEEFHDFTLKSTLLSSATDLDFFDAPSRLVTKSDLIEHHFCTLATEIRQGRFPCAPKGKIQLLVESVTKPMERINLSTDLNSVTTEFLHISWSLYRESNEYNLANDDEYEDLIETLGNFRDAVQVYAYLQSMRMTQVPDDVLVSVAMKDYPRIMHISWDIWVKWIDSHISYVIYAMETIAELEPDLKQHRFMKQSVLLEKVPESYQTWLQSQMDSCLVAWMNEKNRVSIEEHVKQQLGVKYNQSIISSNEDWFELYDPWDMRAMYSFVWEHFRKLRLL